MENKKPSDDFIDGYPPQHHMLRDLLISVEFPDSALCAARAPVVPEICTDRGGVHVAVVATLVDVLGASLAIRAVYPDWIATANLSIYTARPVVSGTIVASGRVVRAGQTMNVVEVDISSESSSSTSLGSPVGHAIMVFSRLPRKKDTLEVKAGSTDATTFAVEGSGLRRHYLDEVGVRILDARAGIAEIRMSEYVRNSFHAIQGGIIALFADVAGQCAARAATGQPMITKDMSIHYLSQGKIGPFRSKARVIRRTGDTVLTRVEVVDRGANDRALMIAMTTATL
ncbi:MAG: PaaI family thioesterase [Chloroflexi bacterium]|nr:PaaI family thioesterase [Chloroflexota bacterium]